MESLAYSRDTNNTPEAWDLVQEPSSAVAGIYDQGFPKSMDIEFVQDEHYPTKTATSSHWQ